MNNRFYRVIGIVLVFGNLSLVFSEPSHAASHALLIGVGDYSGTGLESLRGVANDIALIRSLLKTRFSVPDSNIIVLQDSQASHTKVQAAFSDLAQRAKPSDFVYIHYSGHGSYTQDKSERSGQNETWVTFGARSGKTDGLDDRDVLDKEIRQWLAPLYRKTENVVFVSDSCHSATVSRGLSTGVRAAPPDPHPHPLSTASFDFPSSTPGIRIGAARDFESAVETDVTNGGQCLSESKCHGVFSWFWAQALQQAKPGERWSDVFKRAYTLVTVQRGVSQRPQLEGHGEAVMFGGDFPDVRTTIPVTAVDTSKRTATLAAGLVNGVTKGSEYRLFNSEAPDGKESPVAEVIVAHPFESEAIIRVGSLKVGDLVTESTHAYPLEPLHLYVTGDFIEEFDKALLERIQTSLKNLDGFRLTQDKRQANWVVYILRPRKDGDRYIDAPKSGSLPESFRDRLPEAWVVSPQEKLLHDRMRIPLSNLDKGIIVLKENLSRFARATEIKRLEAQRGSAAVSIAASVWRLDNSCREQCLFLPNDKDRKFPYAKIRTHDLTEVTPSLKRGDVLTFALNNQDKTSWYTYLLNIAPDGGIQTVFPSRYANREEALLKAEEFRDLAKDAVLLLDDVGSEVIKVITTRTPIDTRLFDNPGYLASRGEKMNPLERLLSSMMSSRAKAETYEVSEWATTQAEFQVGD